MSDYDGYRWAGEDEQSRKAVLIALGVLTVGSAAFGGYFYYQDQQYKTQFHLDTYSEYLAGHGFHPVYESPEIRGEITTGIGSIYVKYLEGMPIKEVDPSRAGEITIVTPHQVEGHWIGIFTIIPTKDGFGGQSTAILRYPGSLEIQILDKDGNVVGIMQKGRDNSATVVSGDTDHWVKGEKGEIYVINNGEYPYALAVTDLNPELGGGTVTFIE